MVRTIAACVIALAAAVPAHADEAVVYGPRVDALALLMLDQRATFGTPVAPPASIAAMPGFSNFDMRETRIERELAPSRVDLDGFERLQPSGLLEIPVAGGVSRIPPSPGFSDVLEPADAWKIRVLPREFADVDGGRHAVGSLMWIGRVERPPRALDATVVLRVDGKEESPVFSVGGGLAAALWQVLPKP